MTVLVRANSANERPFVDADAAGQPSQTESKTVADDSSRLPWLGLKLIAGDEPKMLVRALVEQGCASYHAEQLVARAVADPIIGACLIRARQARKLSSLVQAFARQGRQSSAAESVPVRANLSAESFFDSYYFANRPVLLKGLMHDWPALGCWTPGYFAERFGEETIEVTADRERDPKFEDRFPNHCRQMKMSNFIEAITVAQGNDLYLVAKNRLLDREPFISLRNDVRPPEGFLKTGPEADPPRIWLGGAGTITPLHHDASNIFFGQIYGKKLVRLIAPFEIENLYNDRTCFSDIDLDKVDYDRFPLFRRVNVVQVIVNPGDFLLLPLGWWHQVRSLKVSISLSFQSFAVPGKPVTWNHYSV